LAHLYPRKRVIGSRQSLITTVANLNGSCPASRQNPLTSSRQPIRK
jgi:hypothetical protein